MADLCCLWWAVPATVLVGVASTAVLRAMTCAQRRYLFTASQLSPDDLTPADLAGSEQRLAKGLTFATVSTAREDEPPTEQLLKYHQHLRDSFPTVFNSPDVVTVETVNRLSLLLTVRGSRPDLSPYLLLSHMDVVPVVEENWIYPPFSGLIQDGCIHGRGAIDVKNTTHAILECLEHRLRTGDRPVRGLYVALGHDEEVNGMQGAKNISQLLQERNVRMTFILDEGNPILSRFFPGISQPLAVVGVGEKGYLELELTAEGMAGHSSIPPLDTAVGRLARAVARLHSKPQPVLFGRGPEMELLRVMASAATPLYRLVYANVWLFGWFLRRVFLKVAVLRASIQTSTAVTIIRAGYKANVVPSHAHATVNHRVSPLQDLESVLAADLRAISDPQVRTKVALYTAPSPLAPFDENAAPFSLLAATAQQLYGPEVLTAPTVLVANTDTRHYLHLSQHVFRFNPIVMGPDETNLFHGDNERLGVDNYHNCIRFYHRLMKNTESQPVIEGMP